SLGGADPASLSLSFLDRTGYRRCITSAGPYRVTGQFDWGWMPGRTESVPIIPNSVDTNPRHPRHTAATAYLVATGLGMSPACRKPSIADLRMRPTRIVARPRALVRAI